jgi:hypothetical protein
MLTNVNSYSAPTSAWCPNVISWKHSFNRLSEEYEIAKKKQQALDGLYEKGKISQSTHDSFNTEIASAVAEIEKQQHELVTKMQVKTVEIQTQIKSLEMLLTNYEIQHVTGEIDDATYTQEINLFSNGLETARRELQTIQEAVNQLCSPSAPANIPEAPAVESAPAQIPETVEVPTAAPPTEVAPSYVVSAPEPIMAPVVEAAPIIEAPVAIAEALIAVPEPVAVVEAAPAPIIEQAAPVVEAPIIEQPAVVEAVPAVEAAVVEAPAAEVVVEAPAVEAAPVEQPAIVEEIAAAPEPAPVVEEVPVAKPALDEFEVAEPDVVQKELLNAVEEIAENPFPQAPTEAHEEAEKATTIEDFAEAHPAIQQATKESLPETSSSESKE